MRILDFEAALKLCLAVIAQAHRDAGGRGNCPYSDRCEAKAFLAELQGCEAAVVRIVKMPARRRRKRGKHGVA